MHIYYSEDDQFITSVLNWIGTFRAEIGEDADLENLEQLNDGVVLLKIVNAISQPLMKNNFKSPSS